MKITCDCGNEMTFRKDKWQEHKIGDKIIGGIWMHIEKDDDGFVLGGISDEGYVKCEKCGEEIVCVEDYEGV